MAFARNTNVVQFPTPQSGGWSAPTHFGLWTEATAGTFLGSSPVDGSPEAPAIGADVEFGATQLVIEIPNGELTNDGATRAVQGFVNAGTIYVSLHSSAPGTTGANELSGNEYARVAVAAWTVAAT